MRRFGQKEQEAQKCLPALDHENDSYGVTTSDQKNTPLRAEEHAQARLVRQNVKLSDNISILYRITGSERRGWWQFDAAADSTGFLFACPNLSNSRHLMSGDVIKCQTLFPPKLSNPSLQG